MEIIGASHSCAAARQSSSGMRSLIEVEYSRIRPHPVQLRLHVCNGSSWSTVANFGVRRILCLMMCAAILAVSLLGVATFLGVALIGSGLTSYSMKLPRVGESADMRA